MASPAERPFRVERFDRLYARTHRHVHAYLLGRTNDPEAAMDLLQETFLQVWRHIDKVEALDEKEERYWLFRIAKNVVIGYYRRSARRPLAAEPDLAAAHSESQQVVVDPASAVVAKAKADAVDRAIRRLPERLRTPLVMSVLGGMTSSEIGAVLDQPPGTVRYHINQARRRLARELAQEGWLGGEADGA